jgi:AcrR family transcriptional regulator
MSPKTMDKDEKRQDIVKKAYDFIFDFGISNFSTNSFIKHLKIGKSSLYHYFKSKDEILYEVYYRLILSDIESTRKRIDNNMSLTQKLEIVFDFYLCTSHTNRKVQEIYVEFLHIYSDKKIEKMTQYDEEIISKMQKLLNDILQLEIDKKTIKPESLNLIKSIIITADGMLLYSFALTNFNLSTEFQIYLDNLINLIQIKK